MINWLLKAMGKEARRFRPGDRVRYWTDSRKGHNKVVLTPNFSRGTIKEFDPVTRHYIIDDGQNPINIHPRNIVHDRSPAKADNVPPSASNNI